jgi:hypothetical protein
MDSIHRNHASEEGDMLGLILLIVLILLLFGSFPVYPHSRSWGYRPVGGIGLVLVILLILILAHVVVI